jgi:hypothetical protein
MKGVVFWDMTPCDSKLFYGLLPPLQKTATAPHRQPQEQSSPPVLCLRIYINVNSPSAAGTLQLLQLFSGTKRLGREADHSPASSVEVKNGGSVLPLPPTPSWRGA